MGEVSEGGVGREEEGSIDGVEPQVPFGERGGVRRAVEEMGGGVWVRCTMGAEVVARLSNSMEEGLEHLGAATA